MSTKESSFSFILCCSGRIDFSQRSIESIEAGPCTREDSIQPVGLSAICNGKDNQKRERIGGTPH